MGQCVTLERVKHNLGVAEYDGEAFGFKYTSADTDPVGKKEFLNRFNDVLWHCIFALTDIEVPGTGAIDENVHAGVLGLDGLKRLGDKPVEGLNLKVLADEPVDITRYRVLYSTARGRNVMKVQLAAESPGLKEPFAAYRYLPAHGGFKAYHSASASFILAASASMLALQIDRLKPEETVGRFYTVIRADDSKTAWRLADFATKDSRADRKLPPDPKSQVGYVVARDNPGRYVGFRIVDASTKREMELDVRIAQGLNAATAMLTKRKDAPNKDVSARGLNREKGPKEEWWHHSLSLHNHEKQFVAMGFYGILKAALATHRDHQYVLGPWFWWRDVANELCQADYITSGSRGIANIEIAIICLCRSFRPTFPRPD